MHFDLFVLCGFMSPEVLELYRCDLKLPFEMKRVQKAAALWPKMVDEASGVLQYL